MERKVVEIVCVGTELLLGNIVNTNAQFLSEKLASLGLNCYYQQVVGDNEERLTKTLELALGRSDIVILSGGLGPTQDDLTKEVAARVSKKEMFLHEESKEAMLLYFEKKGVTPTDNNYKQALIPEGAIVLKNNNGTAPGVIIPYENKHIILLPGPPNELKPMFNESVVPFLKGLSDRVLVSKTVKICSVGESKAETMIKDLIDNQTNPTIATYAKTGEVHIRVTGEAHSEKEAEELIKPVVKELKTRFGENIYSTLEDVTLEKSIVDLLNAGKLKVQTVESCTGGMVAARIINAPGASKVFSSGLVTYQETAKRKLAGVKKSTLDKYSAVSEETAREMCKGTDISPKAEVICSVTGYAGPDTGDGTETGLVYIGCNVCGNTVVKKYKFSGNRNKIRESATVQALILMRECILSYLSNEIIENKI